MMESQLSLESEIDLIFSLKRSKTRNRPQIGIACPQHLLNYNMQRLGANSLLLKEKGNELLKEGVLVAY